MDPALSIVPEKTAFPHTVFGWMVSLDIIYWSGLRTWELGKMPQLMPIEHIKSQGPPPTP